MHAHPAGSSAILFGLFLLLPGILAVLYLVAAESGRGRRPWSRWRTSGFLVGIAIVMTAMSPPIMHWAHGDLRGHMVQHLMLGMFAPLALVLAAPGTLLLRNVPVRTARRMVTFMGKGPVRFLLHPVTAALLDIGGMYVLYLTPLYGAAMGNPSLHVLLHVHFLLAGYLFTWSIAGPDPAPHRPGLNLRLGVLFLATAAHAILGKIMYAYGHPRLSGADPAELRNAAQWMYYGGDLAEVLLACALFAIWFRRGRTGPACPPVPAG